MYVLMSFFIAPMILKIFVNYLSRSLSVKGRMADAIFPLRTYPLRSL